jgi:apolipoprotein N-acyltransferase
VLLALPFLVAHVWAIHYVALVPWALLLARPQGRLAWLYVIAGMLAFLVIAAGSFSAYHWSVPLIIALVYTPFLILFPLVVRVGHRRLGLPFILLLPVAWVATEWVRIRFSMGHAALYVLGTAHFPVQDVIQIAELTGVAGVSFVVAAGSGALADLVVFWRRRRRAGLLSLAGFVLLLAGVLAYGRARVEDITTEPGPRMALVQSSTSHDRDRATALRTFEEQLSFTRSEIARGRADLIVWPENAVSVPLSADPRFMEGLRALAQEQGAEIVFGAPTLASRDPSRAHTSAYHLSRRGEVLGRYDKLYLIPWAEFIPFQGWLGSLSPNLARAHGRLSRRLLGYETFGMPGRELVLFETEGEGREFRFATPLRFEITMSGFAREATSGGADFLLNIASEGVFGSPLYRHMLGHAILRAVENRVAVVRVGNEGISGFIDASGRARLLRGRHTSRLWLEEGTLIDRVPTRAEDGGTFYTRRGDLLAYLCVAMSAVLLIVGWRRRRAPPGLDNPPAAYPR